MLELLNSNYRPVIMGGQTFDKVFFEYFNKSLKLTAASGYVSEDSIADLLMLYKTGAKTNLELIVGMHLFEGFSYGQYDSLCSLNGLLKKENLGAVYLSSSFKYHGKVYLFQETTAHKVSILGSSNLTKINSPERIYDTDVISDDEKFSNSVESLLLSLRDNACESIDRVDTGRVKIIPPDNLFEDYFSVKKVESKELAEIQSLKTDVRFEIPLKDEEKSNLNVYFGKPRVNFSNGASLPRPWYEVELIVSKKITGNSNYPKPKVNFDVITDDGYRFACRVSGDFSKNFRSADDLQILGRWIKGRMENKRALNIGEKVTESNLKKYGRNTITLTKTKRENVWFLDFGV